MLNSKNKIFFLALISLMFIVPISSTKAALDKWDDNLNSGATATLLYADVDESETTQQRIAKYIGGIFAFAPFLGIHFILRIIIGGYEWMTAAGNSEKIETAKKRMKNATIGIFIFATIYFIAYFFVTNLARIAGYNI